MHYSVFLLSVERVSDMGSISSSYIQHHNGLGVYITFVRPDLKLILNLNKWLVSNCFMGWRCWVDVFIDIQCIAQLILQVALLGRCKSNFDNKLCSIVNMGTHYIGHACMHTYVDIKANNQNLIEVHKKILQSLLFSKNMESRRIDMIYARRNSISFSFCSKHSVPRILPYIRTL